MTTTGHVVYQGPSALGAGAPIVAIVTNHSENEKTGDMPQLWILSATVAPPAAQKSGDDSAVCGDCPARPFSGGDCYVLTFQGPRSVWESWQRGRYSIDWPVADGRPIRLGAYGDPAALPREVIERLTATYGIANATGYTHQWALREDGIAYAPNPAHAWLSRYVMASCETLADVEMAHANGWRTFRAGAEAPLPSEILCPASTEAGKRTQCRKCRLCNGSSGNSPRSIYIGRHGGRAIARRLATISRRN